MTLSPTIEDKYTPAVKKLSSHIARCVGMRKISSITKSGFQPSPNKRQPKPLEHRGRKNEEVHSNNHLN